MYISFLIFLLINNVLSGLPKKLMNEILLHGIYYIGWNTIKITYQGITYSASLFT